MTFDVIKAIKCVIIMLLSLLFLFLIFMLNINELLLLFFTLTLLRFYATFYATYLHNHIVFNANFLPSYYFDNIG